MQGTASIACSYGVIELITYIYLLFDGEGEVKLKFIFLGFKTRSK